MKFDPLTLIRIAQRNGVGLTRIGNNIRINNSSSCWVLAVKKHKRKLLKYLPEDEIQSLQVDLFEDL